VDYGSRRQGRRGTTEFSLLKHGGSRGAPNGQIAHQIPATRRLKSYCFVLMISGAGLFLLSYASFAPRGKGCAPFDRSRPVLFRIDRAGPTMRRRSHTNFRYVVRRGLLSAKSKRSIPVMTQASTEPTSHSGSFRYNALELGKLDIRDSGLYSPFV